jgi:hypothetical protein
MYIVYACKFQGGALEDGINTNFRNVETNV